VLELHEHDFAELGNAGSDREGEIRSCSSSPFQYARSPRKQRSVVEAVS
jgi:hypothetical protein